MRDDAEILIGDRVELTGESDRVYRTKIEDMYEGGAYLVSVPSYGRVPMELHIFDDLIMAFYRESGRFTAPVRVMDINNSTGISYAVLLVKSEPRRDQRREAFRVPVRVKVLICGQAEETDGLKQAKEPDDKQQASGEPVTVEQAPEETAAAETIEAVGSRDISLTGIALITRKKYQSGKYYLLKLHLNDPSEKTPVVIRARVVRSVPGYDRNTFDIGMRFHGQTKTMNTLLSRYMFTQQQKQLKRKRLVESDKL